jgi:hypothetical protein
MMPLMLWIFAFIIGYLLGHIPIHKAISFFTKTTCSPTVFSNIKLKQYTCALWMLSWFLILPFILWYLFYIISLNQYIASFVIASFTIGNGVPIIKKYQTSLQIYPFVSLLFILSFKIAFIAVIISSLVFIILRKPLKTRVIFVFISLTSLMLFPEKLTDIFYIIPIGILLLIADHDMVLNNRESKFKWS